MKCPAHERTSERRCARCGARLMRAAFKGLALDDSACSARTLVVCSMRCAESVDTRRAATGQERARAWSYVGVTS